jgi:hypothetical protein
MIILCNQAVIYRLLIHYFYNINYIYDYFIINKALLIIISKKTKGTKNA